MTLALNDLRAISVRLLVPWTGVWIADIDFDLADVPVMPTGKATATAVDVSLAGTIDPRGSGRFGSTARARLVAGAGGWDQTVANRHWHNDAGVLSTSVLTATASEVGEQLVEAAASRLAVDFTRMAGTASSVLAGLDWWVDFAGVTRVGPRPTVTPPADLEILSWDPRTLTAEIACDSVLVPGTVLTDSRFDGPQTVRDVEQTFSEAGVRATAYCAAKPVSRLAVALTRLVEARAGVAFLKSYRYRVVSQATDGRVTLQAVSKTAGAPDLATISNWYGIPGASAKLAPGAIVLVEFPEGDKGLPAVRSYADGKPIEVTIDASVKVNVGTGAHPVVRLTPDLVTWIASVTAYVNGLAPGSLIAPTALASAKFFAE